MAYFATNILVQHAIRTAGLCGVPRQEILDHLKLDERELFRPGGMVPTQIMFDAVEYSALRSGRADFGLQLGESIPDGIIAGMAILLAHCSTLGHAADEIGRHFHLINSGVAIETTTINDSKKLKFHLLCRGAYEPVHVCEMQLLVLKRFGQFMAGRELHPEAMHLPHSMLSSADRYEKAFSCRITFNAGETAGIFGEREMKLPVSMNREHLHVLVQQAFESVTRAVSPSSEDFSKRVASVVRKLLPAGDVSSVAVAAAMNLSLRSLQRRLAMEGTSLRSIVGAEKGRLTGAAAPASPISSKKV